ncbi:alanine racemase [Betaproteobacteria bacterium]|nr:alanine racemase [Betaproteobacteria bacterium]
MLLEQLETPALILDLDSFDVNMQIMKSFMESSGLALRPHYKSHKCPAIAQRQIAAGAKGITCAKLSEAEDIIFAGIEDVLIANQIVEKEKLARLAYLAGCCKLAICVDRVENIRDLEKAAAVQGNKIHCFVEYEIGMNRCGVDSPEDFFTLAREIESSPHLIFEGIQAYAGHLSHEADYEIRKNASEQVEKRLTELIAYVESRGIKIEEVSGGSTGTVEFRGRDSVYTEIQAGSYIFMDAAYNTLGLKFQNALYVASTVMSVTKNRIVVDAGRKSVSVDQEMPVFKDFPELPVTVSEEHSAITSSSLAAAVGDRLLLIPGHCCTTINLHDHLFLLRKDKVIDRIEIMGRGKSI